MKNLKFASYAMLAIIVVSFTSCFEKTDAEANDVTPALSIAGKWNIVTASRVLGTTETFWTVEDILKMQMDAGQFVPVIQSREFFPDQELMGITTVSQDGTGTRTYGEWTEKCVFEAGNKSFLTFPSGTTIEWTVEELTETRLVIKGPTTYCNSEPSYQRQVYEKANN